MELCRSKIDGHLILFIINFRYLEIAVACKKDITSKEKQDFGTLLSEGKQHNQHVSKLARLNWL